MPVRFGVKENKDGSLQLYILICENKKEARVVTIPGLDKPGANIARRASEISLSRYIHSVNSSETSILKYLPDGLLTNEQLAGKQQGILDTEASTAEKNNKHYKEAIENGRIKNAEQMLQQAAEYHGYILSADGKVYVNEKGSEKLPTVTYDDNGDLIPISERYDSSNDDPRRSIDVSLKEARTAKSEYHTRGDHTSNK